MYKTILTLILVAGLLMAGKAQTPSQPAEPPRWLNTQYRATNFPGETFFSDFQSERLRSGETQSAAISRLKKVALGNIADNIKVDVNSITQSFQQSLSKNGQEDLWQQFSSSVTTASKATILGVNTPTYYNPSTGEVSVFCYVKKAELIKKYQNTIANDLNSIQIALQNADNLFAQKMKMKAKKECERVVPLLAKIAYAQDLLVAVDENVSEAGLQRQRTQQLSTQLVQTLANMEQSVFVYIQSTEDNFGTPVTILKSYLKKILKDNDAIQLIEDADKANQADFKVTINASTSKYSNGATSTDGSIFANVNIAVKVLNPYTNKLIYNNSDIEVKGGAYSSLIDAGKQAYKNAIDNSSEPYCQEAYDMWKEVKDKITQ